MTQKELATLLGVTPSTVLKSVKGAPDISAETRSRILTAMEAHGIKIERERRIRGRTVLVVTPEFRSDFYAQKLSCLHCALLTRGLSMLTISVEQDFLHGREQIRHILRTTSEICGMILLDEALQHLIKQGRRRIAFAGEILAHVKREAFRAVMAQYGMPADERYVYTSSLRFEQAGEDGFAALFSLEEPPDAIICAYDYIALGVLNAAEVAGIKVP